MTHSKFKGLTLCSLAALFAAGQTFAHTGVRDVATEGTASYNGFTIGHGCADYNDVKSDQYPVIGQVALFPFGPYAVWRLADGTVVEGGNGNGTISATSLALNVTGYAGSGSPFATTQEIVDGDGIVHALLWKDGAVEPKLSAITPFKITAPTIVNNCTRLKIKVGVINYCDVNKNAANDSKGPYNAPKDAYGRQIPFTASYANNDGKKQHNVAESPYFTTLIRGNGDHNRADWWFQNLYYNPAANSAVYNDPAITDEAGLWSAVITVNNSAAQLDTCPKDPASGNPILTEVTVEPSGTAFDKFLSGVNTRPFTQGDTNL